MCALLHLSCTAAAAAAVESSCELCQLQRLQGGSCCGSCCRSLQQLGVQADVGPPRLPGVCQCLLGRPGMLLLLPLLCCCPGLAAAARASTRSLTEPGLLTALMLALLLPAWLACTLPGDLGPSSSCWGAGRWLTAVEQGPATIAGCGSTEVAWFWSRISEELPTACWLPFICVGAARAPAAVLADPSSIKEE